MRRVDERRMKVVSLFGTGEDEKMVHGRKGLFVVIDGLDGSGKGVIQDAVAEQCKITGLRVLDLNEFWKNSRTHPIFTSDKDPRYYVDMSLYDVVLTSEPTYCGIGKMIRDEFIKTGSDYTATETAAAYGLDREILHRKVLFPLLDEGKIIVQSRNVVSSLVYQPVQAEERRESLTREDVVSIHGNNYCLENGPNLVVIPVIQDPSGLMERLKGRKKKDDSCFERLEFQMKLNPHYQSNALRELLEGYGSKVGYVDASQTEVVTIRETLGLLKKEYGEMFGLSYVDVSRRAEQIWDTFERERIRKLKSVIEFPHK